MIGKPFDRAAGAKPSYRYLFAGVITDVVTQACQSYAVYLGIVEPKIDQKVLESLISVPQGMSPQHSLTQPIRLAGVLAHFGKEVFLDEMKRVYLYQAKQTGSL